MKRLLILLSAVLLVAGCGTGSHSMASGKADEAAVVFFADQSYTVDVFIDHNVYQVKTVKNSDYKKKRNIRKTVENIIIVTPGQHDIIVRRGHGKILLSQKFFVSAGDTKAFNL